MTIQGTTSLRRASAGLIALVSLALLACGGAPAPPTSVRDISQQEFVAHPPAAALILDVRSEQEFASGHVPGAINIPHDRLTSDAAGALGGLASERDAPIVVYCESGGRAGRAGAALLEAGYTNVLHLDGDMRAWRAAGQPVATP